MSAWKNALRSVLHRIGLIQYYFRAVEWRLARGREAPPAADEKGVPVPPLNLMALTVAHADWRAFLKTGEATAKALANHAATAGTPFGAASRILDFGCGAGRVIRHLPELTEAELHGIDYNEKLLGWCAENLHGTFLRNELTPPLGLPDAHFDILYALSVFTHLREETQREWLREYARILRPGGLALISFHEQSQPGFPESAAAQQAMRGEGFYVLNNMVEGSNLISTFQTREHLEGLCAGVFEVVQMIPRDEAGIGQSLAVLRRPVS